MDITPFDSLPDPDKRLQTEWLFINALRELESIVNPGVPVLTYKQTIDLALSYFPQLFSTEESILGNHILENELIRKYRQEATAESTASKTVLTPLYLAKERQAKLKTLLKTSKYVSEVDELKKELKKLEYVIVFFEEEERREEEYFSPPLMPEGAVAEDITKYTKITEDQALRHDHYFNRPGHKSLKDNWGKFRDVTTSDGQIMRLRILHPNKPEHSLGADIIYEMHHKTEKKLRFVHIQYKLWENGVLYFSQHTNLEPQLKKLGKALCKASFCCCEEGNNISSGYRLPFCSAFLRPTDKLQHVESKMISSGWHLPVCKIDTVADTTENNNKYLTLDKVKKSSLSHNVFEEVFNAEMLGSRWLSYEEVETLYREHHILDDSEKIIIYAQKQNKKEPAL